MNKHIVKKYAFVILGFVMFTVVFLTLEYHNNKYSIVLDKSKGLNNQTQHILKQLKNDKAVKFDIYANPESVVAKKIQSFFKPMQRINPEFQVHFIDPLQYPSKVKANAVTMQGEMVLNYLDSNKQGKVNITELSESAVINAIQQLLNNKNEWIVFAEGFGMRSIDDESTSGLSQWLVTLKKYGYHVARMPLNPETLLPDNVKLIVLPAPTQYVQNASVKWLQQQMQNGISIWWLDDIDSLNQSELELSLDVMMGDKTPINDDKYVGYVNSFPSNNITENFNQPIYIAEAREISTNGFNTLIETDNQTIIAVSKQNSNYRLVVTGDTDFISNQYINSAANKSFAIRVIDWLLYHDDRINISVQINSHTQLFLSKAPLIALSVFFLLLLPLLYMVIAWKKWRVGRG